MPRPCTWDYIFLYQNFPYNEYSIIGDLANSKGYSSPNVMSILELEDEAIKKKVLKPRVTIQSRSTLDYKIFHHISNDWS